MTTMAYSTFNSGMLQGIGRPSAGTQAALVSQSLVAALFALKSRANPAFVLQDLRNLAVEEGIDYPTSGLMQRAERFLYALPSHLPTPELSIDADGEIVFDWRGTRDRLLTVTLRSDGRLTYACRLSSDDKEHGTKQFIDEIPRSLFEFIRQVTRH